MHPILEKHMAYILVMDDDDSLRSVMVEVLEKLGHSVSAFNTADQGIEAAKRGSFDLVVTDILMPGASGLDAILELRSVLSDVPILAVSGGGDDSSESYLEIADRLGADKTLTKPFAAEEFRNAVAGLLDRKEE
jgi:CheY-like chemotaxis protein